MNRCYIGPPTESFLEVMEKRNLFVYNKAEGTEKIKGGEQSLPLRIIDYSESAWMEAVIKSLMKEVFPNW